jgi:hypothetical protein
MTVQEWVIEGDRSPENIHTLKGTLPLRGTLKLVGLQEAA